LSIKAAPSKMNLIRFRRTLSFLRRAHGLLEEKRDILLLEVSRRLGEATKVRGELNALLKSAYASQDAAATAVGTDELKRISASPIATFQVNASNKKIMGVTTLALELTDLKRSLSYSISRPTVLIDDAAEKFLESIPVIVRVAELESTLINLVEEVKRTQRRINALEQFLIPRYEDTVLLISGILEERDREEFVRVKKVKSLIEKRAQR